MQFVLALPHRLAELGHTLELHFLWSAAPLQSHRISRLEASLAGILACPESQHTSEFVLAPDDNFPGNFRSFGGSLGLHAYDHFLEFCLWEAGLALAGSGWHEGSARPGRSLLPTCNILMQFSYPCNPQNTSPRWQISRKVAT